MSQLLRSFVFVLSLNLGLLGVLIFIYLTAAEKKEFSKIVYEINDNESKPFVIFNKDFVDISFSDPSFIEAVNPDETTYKQRMKKINLCKPFLREYAEQGVNYNPELSGDFPSFIPVFKERANAIGYEYDPKKYKEMISRDWQDYNPLLVLGYNNPLTLPIRTPHAANLGTPSVFSVRIFGRKYTNQ